jgi:AraC family transcriptional regulator of arabinose operon
MFMDHRVEFLMLVVEREFSSCSLGRDKLAKLVNLSPLRLQHLFKTETGKTPSQCLKIRRLQEVEMLLRTEFLSVKEAMNRGGLGNYSNFMHDFKRRYGTAPGKYLHRERPKPKTNNSLR